MNVVAIVGSAARSQRTRRAVEATVAGALAAQPTTQFEIVDLSELRISMADGRPPEASSDDTARVVSATSRAEAVILATPIYRGSYTRALKNLLDQLPLEALEGKPVGLLATGATDHHALAIDLQLRGVLAWFNAYLVSGSVYVTHANVSSEGEIEERTRDRLAELGAATVELAACLPKGPPRPHALARLKMRPKAALSP